MVSTPIFEIGTLLQYGVFVLLAAVCVMALARALWVPLDVYRTPCCGACGHAVADILQGRCPECGGNYAKVGISTPPMAVRLRSSLPLALLAWTTLIAIGAAFAHGWLERQAWASMASTSVAFGPGGGGTQMETYTTDFTPWAVGVTRRGQPQSSERQEYRVAVALSTTMTGEKLDSGTCDLTLRQSGAAELFPLSIELPSGKFTLKDDKGKEIAKGDAVDAALVEKWFKAAGLDTDDPSIKRGMKDAEKIARYAKNDPKAIQTMNQAVSSDADAGALRSNGGSTSYGGSSSMAAMAMPAMAMPNGPGIWQMGLGAGFFGIVYLAGCGFIVWRNRRLIRG